MKNSDIKAEIGLFNDCWQSIDNLCEQYAKSVDLTYISLTVLEIVYTLRGNCTQKLICEYSYLPKQTVNAIIKNFLEKGYIKLKEIESDRRNKLISLSPSGLVYAEKIIGTIKMAEESAWGKLSMEQRKNMMDAMMTYESALKEIIVTNINTK